jgi:hypothetical protein
MRPASTRIRIWMRDMLALSQVKTPPKSCAAEMSPRVVYPNFSYLKHNPTLNFIATCTETRFYTSLGMCHTTSSVLSNWQTNKKHKMKVVMVIIYRNNSIPAIIIIILNLQSYSVTNDMQM